MRIARLFIRAVCSVAVFAGLLTGRGVASPVATLHSDVKFVTADCDWLHAVSIERLPANCDTASAPVATILIVVSGFEGAVPVRMFDEKVHIIWSEPGTAEAQVEQPLWTFQSVPSVKPNTTYRIKSQLCTYTGTFSADDCGTWTPYLSVLTPPAPAAPSNRPPYGIAAPVSLRLVTDPQECRALSAPAPCPALQGGVLFTWRPGVLGCVAQRCGTPWAYEIDGLSTVGRSANGTVTFTFTAPVSASATQVLLNARDENDERYCAAVRAIGESDYRSASSNVVCFRRRDYVSSVKRAIAIAETTAPKPAASNAVTAPRSAPVPR